jgi:hypothetical protein
MGDMTNSVALGASSPRAWGCTRLPSSCSSSRCTGQAVSVGPGAAEVYVLAPDNGAKPGQHVHWA